MEYLLNDYKIREQINEKTKDSRHSKIKDTFIIRILTSFINSETIALLHLTSFTEGVS